MLKLIKNAHEWLYLCLNSPIDFGWELLAPLTVEFLCNKELEAKDIEFIFKKFDVVLANDSFGTRLRNPPSLLLFPGNNSWTILGFCYKYDSKGTTVIAVPDKVGNAVIHLLEEVLGAEDFDLTYSST